MNSELIFLEEAATQLKAAQRAYPRILARFNADDTEEMWESVEQLLNASVRVANIFWPTSNKPSAKRRAARMREILGLESETRFNGLRELRNSFEHIDERIDDWSDKDRPFYADRRIFVGVSEPYGGVGIDQNDDTARSLHLPEGELRVFGLSLSMPALMQEIDSLRKLLATRTGR